MKTIKLIGVPGGLMLLGLTGAMLGIITPWPRIVVGISALVLIAGIYLSHPTTYLVPPVVSEGLVKIMERWKTRSAEQRKKDNALLLVMIIIDAPALLWFFLDPKNGSAALFVIFIVTVCQLAQIFLHVVFP